MVSDTNFSIYRKDRVGNQEGGGVCILTNNASVLVNPVNLPVKYQSLELIVVDIVGLSRESQTKGFRLFVAYRPPCSDSNSISLSYTTLLCECIESLYPINSTIVLCGDFNFPRINWSSNNNVFTNPDSCSGIFINFFFYKYALTQCVASPTRLSDHSGNGSLLDLVVCNDPNFVFNTNVDAPFGSSDHGTVSFNVIRELQTPKYSMNAFNFNKADWTNLSAYLDNINFFDLFENCVDPESVVNAFYTVLYDGLNQFVPVFSSHLH